MLRKILHIIAAILILVSTTGFTINVHYCHNQLVDLALYAPAKSCCDTGEKVPNNGEDSVSNKSHCKDESIVIESADDFVDTAPSIKFENAPGIDLGFTVSTLFNIQGTEQIIVAESPWHKEPLPYREVVLSQIQSYLI